MNLFHGFFPDECATVHSSCIHPQNILDTLIYCCCCLVIKLCLTLTTLWTVVFQDPQSVRFFRQEYWSGLPFPSPGDLPNPGIEPASPALAGGFFTTLTNLYAICLWCRNFILHYIFYIHIHQDPVQISLPFLIILEKNCFLPFSLRSCKSLGFFVTSVLFRFILCKLFCLFSYPLDQKLLKSRDMSKKSFCPQKLSRICWVEQGIWKQAKRHSWQWG